MERHRGRKGGIKIGLHKSFKSNTKKNDPEKSGSTRTREELNSHYITLKKRKTVAQMYSESPSILFQWIAEAKNK